MARLAAAAASLGLFLRAVSAWEPMPDGYELLDAPQLRDAASIKAWRAEWQAWKDKELESARYDPQGVCNVYNIPSLQWSQRSFVQVFAMMNDRKLFDRASNKFTVDAFLQSIDAPVDSVLLWPSYPNLGIDPRNQFDLWSVLPGGLDGFRSLVDDFHARNVKVILPYQPWDTATHNPDPTKSRYKSDIATLHAVVAAVGADGINGDTMYGVPASFFNCSAPTVACPEGGLPTETLSVNAMSWGYYYGVSHFPPVSRAKFLEPRHTPLVCARWSLARTTELQMAFFNGVGYVVWENIWGIWNAMTSREWQELKRTAVILQRFPEATHSNAWKPFIPDLPSALHGSAFPDPTRPFVLHTFIRTAADGFDGNVTLEALTFESPSVVAYDLYHGRQVDITVGGDGKTWQVPLSIEGYGYGSILVAASGLKLEWLPSFLQKMQNLTEKPLAAFSTDRPLQEQRMTSLPTASSADDLMHAEELTLVPIRGSEAWTFAVEGVQIEPVLMWTPHGDEIYGVGVQFPWERRPSPHHKEQLWLDDFEIMKYPVTNAQFQAFLRASNYTPPDLDQFLLTWVNRRTTSTAAAYRPIHEWTFAPETSNHPVVHVAVEDARAFAAFYGLRLPHDWEWQYVASNGAAQTLHPWGNETPAELTHVPSIVRDGNTVPLLNVGSFPAGCTSAGVCDLEGHVWEMTDSFCDPHTCSLLLRGGSRYQPIASSLNDPNWYFPAVKSVQEHGKWLLLSPSYDRSATVGFRCVRGKSSDDEWTIV
ncbi:unnamed protein product [Aphanomyces euteiches]